MSFNKRLSSGDFVVLAHMNTPKGVNISEMVINARRIKERVHGVVIPDMDNGVMRMSAIGGAVLMRQQGLEPVIHVYGRDRNRMAIQGDVLAAHVLGIENLVVVKGENMASGDHVDARPVDDLDEIAILKAIKSLESGRDMAGFELDGSPSFTLGCTLGPFVDDQSLAQEIDRVKRKIEAGAQFVITPYIFDMNRLVELVRKIKELGVFVLSTVFLLKTVSIARYIATYEPGAFIKEDLIKRMRQSKDRETEGFIIAGEMIKGLRGIADGVQIVTLGWEHRLPSILDYADL
ncbi:MAG: methylenetetrahydrofolate reductase [Deltaproteobacteria bacterium]|nr:methylenetetrahydrofolate reductase [Deltaproteobacteria bacterium]